MSPSYKPLPSHKAHLEKKEEPSRKPACPVSPAENVHNVTTLYLTLDLSRDHYQNHNGQHPLLEAQIKHEGLSKQPCLLVNWERAGMNERALSTGIADAQVKTTTWKKCLEHAITSQSLPCHQVISVLKMPGSGCAMAPDSALGRGICVGTQHHANNSSRRCWSFISVPINLTSDTQRCF